MIFKQSNFTFVFIRWPKISPVECLIALSTYGSLSTESTCTSIKPVTENVARPTLGWHKADVARSGARNALTRSHVEWMIWRQYCTTMYPRRSLNVNMFVNLQVLLDDHIVKTMTMKGSPFVVPFEAELKEWESKLVSLTLTFFPFLFINIFLRYLILGHIKVFFILISIQSRSIRFLTFCFRT